MSSSPRVKPSCVPCRNSKRRCDHERPCRRCVKYGLTCVPHNRGPGRPSSKRGPPPLSVSPPKPPPPPAPYVTREVPMKHAEPAGMCLPPRSPSGYDSGLTERISEIISMTIIGLGRQGRLDGPKLLATLGAPEDGSDPTIPFPICGVRGLSGTLRWALDVAAADPPFRMPQPAVGPLLDEDSCYICITTRGPELLEAYANERMSELFVSSDEQRQWVRESGLPCFYAWARFVASEDLSAFYSIVARSICEAGTTDRLDTVVRCRTKTGEWVRCMTSIACELDAPTRRACIAVRFWPLLTRLLASQQGMQGQVAAANPHPHKRPSPWMMGSAEGSVGSMPMGARQYVAGQPDQPWQQDEQAWAGDDVQPRKRAAVGSAGRSLAMPPTNAEPVAPGMMTSSPWLRGAPPADVKPLRQPLHQQQTQTQTSHGSTASSSTPKPPSGSYNGPSAPGAWEARTLSPLIRAAAISPTAWPGASASVGAAPSAPPNPPAMTPLDSLFKALEIMRNKGDAPRPPVGPPGPENPRSESTWSNEQSGTWHPSLRAVG